MSKTKYLGTLLLIVVVVIVASGCASKENTDSTADSAMQDMRQKQDTWQKSDIDIVDQQAVDNQTEATQDSENVQIVDPQIELKKLEPFSDPQLTNMDVRITGPVNVVRLELMDKRDYEESTNWEVHALLSNNGSQPIYVNARLANPGYIYSDPVDYYILDSGNRMWINLSACAQSPGYTFDHMPILAIISKETVLPDVSPEFKNLKKIFMHRVCTLEHQSPFVDIHSIKYVVKDESKGWKSLVMEASIDGNESSDVTFTFCGNESDGYYTPGPNADLNAPLGTAFRVNEVISPGEIKQIEVPLRDLSPEDFYQILINS